LGLSLSIPGWFPNSLDHPPCSYGPLLFPGEYVVGGTIRCYFLFAGCRGCRYQSQEINSLTRGVGGRGCALKRVFWCRGARGCWFVVACEGSSSVVFVRVLVWVVLYGGEFCCVGGSVFWCVGVSLGFGYFYKGGLGVWCVHPSWASFGIWRVLAASPLGAGRLPWWPFSLSLLDLPHAFLVYDNAQEVSIYPNFAGPAFDSGFLYVPRCVVAFLFSPGLPFRLQG